MIGRGSYGKVYLIERHDNPNEVYAMKTIKKTRIIEEGLMEATALENEILMETSHPFLMGMHYVFQSDNKIMFVMPFAIGGELCELLRRRKRFDEEEAKIYVAQIVLALGHLHKSNILYRDLKAENVLIGDDGYLMLTDFGLAKRL